ncbi:MAG: SGNH/GDSL hydrolase family protein [Methanobacteriota archaeon]
MMPTRPALVILAFSVFSGCLGPSDTDETGGGPPTGSPEPTPLRVVGALGDSLMNGWNADAQHEGAHPEVSWSTGDAEWSFARRFGANATENVAVGGAASWNFVEQVDGLEHATFALVGFAGGGLCTAFDTAWPPPPDHDLERELREGIRRLKAQDVTVMMTTVPDFASIGEAGRVKGAQGSDHALYLINQACGSEPGFQDRLAEMNAIIIRVADDEGTLHDGEAIGMLAWTADMVSEVDGFHPSPAGLEAMADAAWSAYADATGFAPAALRR